MTPKQYEVTKKWAANFLEAFNKLKDDEENMREAGIAEELIQVHQKASLEMHKELQKQVDDYERRI